NTFVVDAGPGLDTGCTFNTDAGHPLTISLPVTRAVGEVDAEGYLVDAQALIDAQVIPAYLTLRLPAYDVDIFGGPPPERDEIFFNGTSVGFLTGNDDIWVLNQFQVDIRKVKFPAPVPGGGPVTPRINTIQVYVDQLSVGSWCTSVDWVSLEGLKSVRPVLFLHGFLGDPSIWNSAEFSWQNQLDQLGIPHKAITLGKTSSIQDNSLLVAQAVAELKEQYGVDKVNIVAHSKGGLDSRAYITNNDDVETLIQLATPNAGSPLADIAPSILIGLGGLPGLAATIWASPAIRDLSPFTAAIFNRYNPGNPNTKYVSLAGNHSPGGMVAGAWYLAGPDDNVVQVSSVHALPYATHLEYASEDEFSDHSGVYRTANIFAQVESYLKQGGA